LRTLVCSADKIKNIRELKTAGKIPSTTHVIYFDEVEPEELSQASSCGLTLVSFKEVVNEGGNYSAEKDNWDHVTSETIYTFSYTSGTTGVPKGVMLTHMNFVSNIGGLDLFKD
jgi:long-chain acyl-CoA synthetase